MIDDDDPTTLPFPFAEVSNGEWCPRGPTATQCAAAREYARIAEESARRTGVSRRRFVAGAAGIASGFLAWNRAHGAPTSGGAANLPVTREQAVDAAAAAELFRDDYFVMDVQLHHVDMNLPGIQNPFVAPRIGCLRFVPPAVTCTLEGFALLSQDVFLDEVFIESETHVGVISGLPGGFPLPVDTMAETRDLVNARAGTPRCLSRAMCDPLAPATSPISIQSLERQVSELGAVALKCYTGSGGWWLDDEEIAYPMLAEAQRVGLRTINVHKGFPGLLQAEARFTRSRDFPKVLRDWPALRFVAYHSGYFPGAEGPSPTKEIDEFLGVVRGLPPADRKRLYAEIGSSFARAWTRGPDAAAHFIGALLRDLGSRRILWGTDSIWWGTLQWQIEALKALTISDSLQEAHGYPPLTENAKARILGLNAADLYGVRPSRLRRPLERDALSRIRDERRADGAVPTPRRNYGPRTSRQFLNLLAHEAASGAQRGA